MPCKASISFRKRNCKLIKTNLDLLVCFCMADPSTLDMLRMLSVGLRISTKMDGVISLNSNKSYSALCFLQQSRHGDMPIHLSIQIRIVVTMGVDKKKLKNHCTKTQTNLVCTLLI